MSTLTQVESRKSQRSVRSTSAHQRASTDSATTSSKSVRGSSRELLTRVTSRARNHRPLSYVSSRPAEDTESKKPTKDGLLPFEHVFRLPEKGCVPKPPAKLTAEQQAKYEKVLAYFQGVKQYPTVLQDKRGSKTLEMRAASDWEKSRMLTRDSMLRYLRATKWDVEAAKKRLTDTIAWRREYGVDEISSDYVEAEAKSGKETVLGFDKNCRPLHYMHPHWNDTQESPRQMKFAVWILEACIDLMPPGVEQLALLINFENKSRNPTSISNAKMMLYILQNHYVERLGIALCINVPWIFKAFYNAIQSFIDPVTKAKCKFDEAIKDEVPGSQLTADFGGNLDPTYNHEKYWPELVELLKTRREEMLDRFVNKCKGEIGATEWVIRGGEDEEPPLPEGTKEMFKEKVPDQAVLIGTGVAVGSGAAVAAAVASSANADAPQDVRTKDHAVQANGHAEPAAQEEEKSAESKKEVKGASEDGEKVGMPPLSRNESRVSSGGEVFLTPSEDLNEIPLERKFSTITKAPTIEETPGQEKEAEEHEEASKKVNGVAVVPSTPPSAKHAKYGTDSSVRSAPDPETPRPDASYDKEAMQQHFKESGHHIKEGFQEFVKGGSHFFKNLKHGVAGVGIHSHGHRREGSRTASNASTLLGDDDKKPTSRSSSPKSSIIGRKSRAVQRSGSVDSAGTGTATASSTASAAAVVSDHKTPVPVVANGHAPHGAEKQEKFSSPPATGSPASSGKTIKVLYFAGARTAVHKSEEQIELPEAPFALAKLNALLVERHRAHDILGEFEKVVKLSKWSVNEEMVDAEEAESKMLQGGEEVAIIPPVSGG